ncbi:chaperonin 10-like protein [Mycena olivaceomarginata]|nr:chaperonin 10-like protein [Mycena olivaceomarginata]
MKALLTTGDGGFALKDVAIPILKEDEILVRTCMGWDFAGTICQVPPNCPNRKLGEHVAGLASTGRGAFAEYVAIPGDLTIQLPPTVSFEDAAGLGTACISACQCLYQELNIPMPGADSTPHYAQSILIWSSLPSAPVNHDFVKSLGADVVFDHSDSQSARQIFHSTEGTLVKAVDCWSQGMSPNQVSVSLSRQGGEIATLLPYESRTPGVKAYSVAANSIYGKDTSFPFVTVGSTNHLQNGKAYCKLISTLITQNKLKFVPAKLYPGGLLGVAAGIEDMRLGKVHAQKITCRIAETSQSNRA